MSSRRPDGNMVLIRVQMRALVLAMLKLRVPLLRVTCGCMRTYCRGSLLSRTNSLAIRRPFHDGNNIKKKKHPRA
jgi:hypothetical protein